MPRNKQANSKSEIKDIEKTIEYKNDCLRQSITNFSTEMCDLRDRLTNLASDLESFTSKFAEITDLADDIEHLKTQKMAISNMAVIDPQYTYPKNKSTFIPVDKNGEPKPSAVLDAVLELVKTINKRLDKLEGVDSDPEFTSNFMKTADYD